MRGSPVTPLRSLILALVFAAGCGGELTELLVVVDSDLTVPSDLDAIEVTVSGVEPRSASGAITNTDPLPRTVGLVHRGGALGPVEVQVIGRRGGAEVVQARAVTWFVRGRTLVSSECTGVVCPAGRTCGGGACVSASVDPSTLAVWNGTVPSADAGALADGSTCTPSAERCNGADDDCDGAVDEDFDLDGDPMNCGGCGQECTLAGATAGCAAGACTIASCDAGFGDCNGDPTDGCETALDTLSDCGSCGNRCSIPGQPETCETGTCLVACSAGRGDCDDRRSNGCESNLSRSEEHCGMCGNACDPGDNCIGGVCR